MKNRSIMPVSGARALDRNLQAGRSPATHRSYRQAQSAFLDYAGSTLPADPRTVAIYLSELGERAKPATVSLHASAIAALHKDHGIESPTRHPVVKKALKGHACRVGVAQDQADPIDAEAYEKITATARERRKTRGGRLETEETAQIRGLVDVCLIGIMRDAMLRRSEVAALRWEDLNVQRDGSSRVLIRQSKTDRIGEGVVQYVSPALTEALMALWTVTSARDGDLIFDLSASQICRRIASACAQAGLEGNFSGHSPRIGMAQDLARGGVSMPAMMVAGRWRSEKMPAHYTRNVDAAKGAVAQWYRDRSG